MSRNRWKAELSYDSNYGPTVHTTIYLVENNSTDCTFMYRENGDYVEMCGPEEYVDLICRIPQERDYDKIVEIKSGVFGKAIISPVAWVDMPKEVQELC